MKNNVIKLSVIILGFLLFSLQVFDFKFSAFAEEVTTIPTGENVPMDEPVLDEAFDEEVENSTLYDSDEYLLFIVKHVHIVKLLLHI